MQHITSLRFVRTVAAASVPILLAIAILFANVSPVFAATAGPNAASVVTGNTGLGTASWSIPAGSLTSNDSSFATVTLNASQVSRNITATSTGFSIPATATIDGIQVSVRRFESGSSDRVSDNSVRLVKGGVIGGDDKAQTSTLWGQTETTVTYGSISDKWGLTWTPADINANNFGVVFSAKKDSDSNSRVASVDFIQITVSYSLPTTSIGDGTSPASKTIKGSDTNKAVSAFTLAASTGTDTVTGIVVTGTNTANIAASGAKIYQDNGITANEWDASDTLKGTASFSGATATFTGLSIGVTTSATQYLVTYDTTLSPTNTQTLTGVVTGVTATNVIANNDTTDATLTIDTAGPTATFDLQTASDSGSSSTDNITATSSPVYSVAFNEAVSGFDATDVSNTGSATGCTFTVGAPTGNTYPVTASTCSNSGIVTLRIAASGITDALGNPNAQITATFDTYIDRNAPTVEIDQLAGQTDPDTTSPVLFEATFDEAVTGFISADVSTTGSTVGTISAAVSGGNPYTITVTGMDNSGTVIVTIPAGAAIDTAGNLSLASTNTDNSVQFDIPTYNLVATTGTGGTVTPPGTTSVTQGTNQSYVIAPTAGNIALQVLIDGVLQGTRLNAFTFSNVTASHTISATFDGGWSAPTTVASNTWSTGSTNIYTSNNTYATADSSGDGAVYADFSLPIPVGSTINGIEVAMEGNKDSGRSIDLSLSWNSGTTFTAVKNISAFTGTDSTLIAGNSTDKWGRASWTTSELSNANFRLKLLSLGGGGNLNVDQVQVKVHYTLDTTPPVITLIGADPVTVVYGDTYIDAGATTNDGSSIVTVNPVNTNVVGDYVVTYNSTDAAGNAAIQKTRTVHVVQASSTTTVTCPASAVYAGTAQTSCTATVTGAGGLNQSVSVTYTNNIDVGTANASATYAGDANHTTSTNAKTFAITPAPSGTVISCPVLVTYSGVAQTPCIVSVTGAGGLNLTPAASYSNNTNVGTASASYTFSGDTNHSGSSDNKTFAIGKAEAVIAVTPYSVTYDAGAHTAAGSATGVLGEPLAGLDLSATTHTNAGTYNGDTWTFTDATGNYNNTSGTVTDLISKADSATLVTCISPVTYTGSALTPCTATVTGAGGLSLTPAPTYADNINAGIASASYNFAGDADYNPSSDSENFTIDKADVVISITPYAVVYDGGEHTAIGVATGVQAEDLSGLLDLSGTAHTNAGTYASDAWSFAGNANYNVDSGTVSDSIGKADAAIVVTDFTGVYDGAPHGTTGTATGVNSEVLAGLDLGASYTNVPGGSAHWIFTDVTGNYNDEEGDANVTITAAPSTVTLTCSPSLVYTGAAIEPCSAMVTGASGLNESVAVVYDANTNVGTASASATFAGDANHSGDSDATTFEITPATSTTVVSCPVNVIYNALAQTPCTVSVTGAGGLNLTPDAEYSNNTNVGTASASYTFAADANHSGSTDSKNFDIEQADADITVTPYSVTYDGNAHTATGSAHGVGNVDLSSGLTLSGTTHTNVGDYADTWTFHDAAGNYADASGPVSDTISEAESVTVIVCPLTVQTYTGAAIEPCTASVTGVGGLNELVTVTYENNVDAGTATANAAFAGDVNHAGSSDTETFQIAKATATVLLSNLAQNYDGTPKVVTVVTVPAGLTVDVVYDGTNASATSVGPHSVVATIVDANYEGTASDTLVISDNTAPVIAHHDDVTVEATGALTVVAFGTPTATDDVDGTVTVICSPVDGSSFAVGTTPVSCSATDAALNTSNSAFNVIVTDETNPIVTAPADVSVEAAGTLTPVTFADATAIDSVDGTVTATCDYLSGASFPVGSTVVTCSATDAHGNTGTDTFTVTVGDTTAPVLAVPADITSEATSASGAAVTFIVSATDVVDGALTPVCDATSGDTFPIGLTTVHCSATDAASNESTASFTITVTDGVAPTIEAHGDETAEATSASGAVVNYVAPVTHDAVDGDSTALCTPASGTAFALGDTTVTCTAEDATGNAATATTFVVHVLDTTTPTITLNGNATETVERLGSYTDAGAVAHDAVDGDVVLTTPDSVDTSVSGNTTLHFNYTDGAGHAAAEATRLVMVQDTTAPTASVSYDITIPTNTDVVASLVAPSESITVTNNGGSTSYSFTANGSFTFEFEDVDGNPGSATATVTNIDKTAPVITIDPYTLTPVNTDILVTASTDEGSLNTTTHTFTANGTFDFVATDAAGNVTTVTVTITNIDKDGPVVNITNPADAATTDGSVTATYTVDDANATVICVLDTVSTPCGATSQLLSALADGSHTFMVTATDVSANAGSDSVTWNVDAAGPVITLNGANPDSVQVGSGAYTDLGATTDDGSAVVVTDSVDTAIIADYTLHYNATDVLGNAAAEVTRTVHVVDTTAPDTTLTATPTNPTTDTTPTFEFSSELGATFECSLDGEVFAVCGSPFTTATLADGPHTFEVRAKDGQGNTDPTPATYSFVVDATGPVITLNGSADVSIEMGTTYVDAGATANDGSTVITTGSVNTAVIADYVLHYNATDVNGNVAAEVTRTVHVTDHAAPVISGQSATAPTDTTITVTWDTDHPSTSRVVYGTSAVAVVGAAPNYGYPSSTIEDATLVTHHVVVVSGLSNGTTYYFRGVSHGSPESVSSEVSNTTTTPTPSPTTGTLIVKKVIVGDAQANPTQFSFIVTAGDSITPSVVFDADGQNDLTNKAPDTYTVTEVAASGYTATYANCSNIVLAAGETKTCTITNTKDVVPPPPQNATIVATKIVCDNESDLPNWGAGAANITASTATAYVAAHPTCHLTADWTFQWRTGVTANDTTNPGDNSTTPAGAPWTSFGPTNGSGTVSTSVPTGSLIWVREVLKSGYIPFTGVNTNNTVSAEMYCSTDVLHYDNYDFVNPVANGQTYYCVAFNAHTTVTPPTCGEHEHLDGDQCVPDVVVPPTCETGTHLEGEVCVPDVVVPPTCETGMHLEGETCVPDDVGPGVCAVGTHPEQTTPEVSVPFAPNQCAEGLTLTDGQCVAASSAPTCSAGAYNAETNQCEDVSNVEVPATPAICGTGVLNTATDMCEVASVAPTCPENAPNVEGMCTPVAEESETICVPDVVVPPTCETGTHLEGETCVADAPTPAVDVCANLEGDQLEVPSGMNIVNGDQCKTKSRRNGGSSSGRSNGQVLGAATTTEPTLPQGCIPLLNAYLRFGWNNDSEEVKKLQNFLNEHMGLNLPVSGFFGPMTLEAVKSLQTKYWEQILQPWFSFNGSGITGQGSATGFVYQTTKWYINNLSCTDLNAPLPELQ